MRTSLPRTRTPAHRHTGAGGHNTHLVRAAALARVRTGLPGTARHLGLDLCSAGGDRVLAEVIDQEVHAVLHLRGVVEQEVVWVVCLAARWSGLTNVSKNQRTCEG